LTTTLVDGWVAAMMRLISNPRDAHAIQHVDDPVKRPKPLPGPVKLAG
jgi:hypothetical protein